MQAMERVLQQAEKALRGEPIGGLEDVMLGAYGLSMQEIRLGNIMAIAREHIRVQGVAP